MDHNSTFRKRAEAMGQSHVTVKEAGEIMGVCIRTVRYWQSQGKMPERVRFGHTWRYPREAIEELALLRGVFDV